MKKAANPIDLIIQSTLSTDDYTQSSVFGACHWQAAGAAINYALRIIKQGEPEEGSGIDGFTRWMERVAALSAQEMADLKALGEVAEKFASLAGDVMMDSPTIESSIATRIKLFAPSMEASAKRYDDLRRAGERFTVKKAEWVAEDYKDALEQHVVLVNHADTVSGLINRALRDGTDDDQHAWEITRKERSVRPVGHEADAGEIVHHRLPEWLPERLTDKAIEKLFNRHDIVSQRATSTRLKTKVRQEAQGDLFRIDTALKALGEEPPVIIYLDEDGNPEGYARVVQQGKKLVLEESSELFA